MALMTEQVTLHLRAGVVGEDEMGEPIYGQPEDISGVPAWWEPATSAEEISRAELVSRSYWVYTEDTRITAADELTLHGPTDIRCHLEPPRWQPGGYIVGGFHRVLATAVTG